MAWTDNTVGSSINVSAIFLTLTFPRRLEVKVLIDVVGVGIPKSRLACLLRVRVPCRYVYSCNDRGPPRTAGQYTFDIFNFPT